MFSIKRFRSKVKANRKLIIKIIIACAIAFCVGVIGELVYNLPLITSSSDMVITYYQLDEIETKGFKEDNSSLTSYRETVEFTLELDGQYIDKFRYGYEYGYDQGLEANITVYSVNDYGVEETYEINEKNNTLYDESIINIRNNVNKIVVEFPEKADKLQINHVAIDNTGHKSLVRFLFVSLAALIVLLLFITRDIIKNKIHLAFLFLSITIGGVMILAMPPHKVSVWDEEVHFRRAYSLSYSMTGSDQMSMPPAIKNLTTVNEYNFYTVMPQSEEELAQEIAYLNNHGVYYGENMRDEYYEDTYDIQLSDVGYVTQSIMILIGRLAHLPFGYIYILGRFGNLLLYSIVVCFAIKRTVVGKGIMTVIGLLPTSMFLATTYSYDSTVIAFLILSFSCIISELLQKDKLITWKSYTLFIVSTIIACCPKAVYIPLILIGLLLPKSKFKSKRQMFIMKGLIGFGFVCMMATFMLPVATTDVAGDSRGGATSVSSQLYTIFKHPITYAKTLLYNIATTFFTWIGHRSYSLMGSLLGEIETSGFIILAPILLVFVTITDKTKEGIDSLTAKQKVVISALIFITISLIWTALYLAFTPVGLSTINGVQARYYLPILFLIALLSRTDKIKNYIDDVKYNTLILGTSSFIIMAAAYTALISKAF